MGKPYSRDLRKRFIILLDTGMSASAAGRRLMVARSTATRWAWIWRRENRCEALPMGGDRRSASLERYASFIVSCVRSQPDIFLHELVNILAAKGVSASQSALSNLLSRHGLTRKKTLIAKERTREDITKAREEWQGAMKPLDLGSLVFIDESGFDTKMTRLQGRSTRGQPCFGSVPYGHWQNNSFIAGLGKAGPCPNSQSGRYCHLR
ncbi:IS630 transposase-related protein [Flexibacterium corallicola]|uniref:IS630 transposase-related protein n=1 Tax=Flexibacterium corallicola TaxID=3037259 RepID=UPI00286F3F84|nr:IS630 transposase-related protein [Pseudovibrio sp. M1P-2-3]